MERLKEAEKEFNMAVNHFNWAEPDYIDKAIEEYNEALAKLNSVRAELGLPPMEI